MTKMTLRSVAVVSESGRKPAKERLAPGPMVGLTHGTKPIGSGWPGRGFLFAFAAGGTLRAADAAPPSAPLSAAFPILEHPLFLVLLGACLLLLGLLVAARRRLAESNRNLERKVAERTAVLEADLRRREALEKALVESEERFAKAFNHGPVLATISSMATGRLMAANQRFCESLGYSREELLGNRTTDMGIWLNPRQREEFMRQVEEGKELTNREVLIRARDGRILTILVSFERVGLGAEDCLLIFGVDVTERRAVERRLQASEEMFSQAFRHNPLLASITSLVDQRVLDCNDRLCEFVGLTRERLINSVPEETGLWVDTRVRSRLIQRVIHEQVIHNEEIDMRNGRGEVRRLLVSLQRLTLNGEPAALWLSSDITERSRLADAVRLNEQRFRELFEQSGEAITIADAAGRFVDGNPAALAQLRCTLPQLRELLIEDLVAPADRGRLPGHFQRVAAGEQVQGEWRLIRRDGTEFFADVSVRRTAEGGSFAIVRDVTERREALERLRESEALLNETGAIAKVGGWRLELASGKTEWTAEAARMHGVSPGSPEMAEPIISRYTPESAECIRESMRRAAETGEPYSIEASMVLPGGGVRWVRILGRADYQGDQITHLRGTVQDITEFRQALERLQDSEERFSKIFLRTPIIVAISTFPDGRYVEVNECFTRVLGYSPAEVVGQRALDLGIWNDPQERAELVRRVTLEGRVADFEYSLRTRSGELVEVIGAAERIVLGDQPCLMFIAQDVTARKQAERRLRQSENTLQAVFGGMHDALIVADIGTRRLVEANAAAARLLGYPPGELLRLRVDDIHPAEHLPAVLRGFSEQAARDRDQVAGLPMRRKDGRVFFADLSTARLEIEGRPCLVGVFHDVTERMRAEQSLRESEATLAAIFEGVAECIMVADADTRELLKMNSAAEAVFGYGEGDLPRLKVEDLHPEEDRQLVLASFVEQARHSRTAPAEFRFRRRDGSLFVGEITTSRIPLWGRNCLVGLMRDVTARRQTEEALRERLKLQDRIAGLASTIPGIMYSFEVGSGNQWRFLDMGPRTEEIIGISAAEAMADAARAFALVHPADLAELRQTVEQAAVTHAPWNHTFRVRHPAKGTVWLEGHAGPVAHSEGSLVWHGVLLDVTQRQQLAAQRLIRDSVARILADAESVEWAIPKVLRAVCEGEEFDYGELWLLDPADGRLSCEFVWPEADPRFGPLVREAGQTRFAGGEGLPGQALLHGRAIVMGNLAEDRGFLRKESARQCGLRGGSPCPSARDLTSSAPSC